MNIYDELGLVPMINAAGTYTVVGGSRMSEETLQDLADAAGAHVEIPELQEAVQKKIADMTGNETSVVCNGAASGLYLCAISAVALKTGKKSRFLEVDDLAAHEIISFHAQHIPYDFAVKQSGVRDVRVGYPNIEGSTNIEDLEAAIRPNTVAVFYYISSPYGLQTPGALPLEDVISVANDFSLPVIVDAAAQLPPVENLWNFTSIGAAAAIFSGGKYLKGPQSSGLIVGKKSFLETVQDTNFPNYGYGRMLKTGREEIIALYSAIKQYLNSEHVSQQERAEDIVREIVSALTDSKIYQAERVYPNEAAQPMAYVRFAMKKVIDPQKVINLMRMGRPSVFLKQEGSFFYVNPMTLSEDEVALVLEKLIQVERHILQQEESNVS